MPKRITKEDIELIFKTIKPYTAEELEGLEPVSNMNPMMRHNHYIYCLKVIKENNMDNPEIVRFCDEALCREI